MKKQKERLEKIDEKYVRDDYIQLMIPFKKFLFVYGLKEGEMYYKNIVNQTPQYSTSNPHTYLYDERRFDFDYSSAPVHIEKKFFKDVWYANQIFEFEKPYFILQDGHFQQMTAYKEGKEALLYTKVVTEQNIFEPIMLNRKEAENYIETGFIKQKDEKKYDNICLFSQTGNMYKNHLMDEEEYNDEEIVLIPNEPLIMIKNSSNSEIGIDVFALAYVDPNKYCVVYNNINIIVEDLEVIKSNPLLNCKYTTKPVIKHRLNPGINTKKLTKKIQNRQLS